MFENLGHSFEECPLFSEGKLILEAGARLAVIGENGVGKTTLLRCLMSELAPESGSIKWAESATLGYCPQDAGSEFESELTLFDWMSQWRKPSHDDQIVRATLGRLLFKSDDFKKRVAVCSGGEKNRLLFGKLMMMDTNVLLLDEPTNHLDIQMRESISFALQSYNGCLIVVAHDRHLLRLVTDELWLIDDGTLRPFDGDLDDYVNWLRHRQKGTGKLIERQTDEANKKGKDIGIKAEQKTRPSKSTRQERAKQRVKIKPLYDSLNRIEKEIDKATKVQQQLDQQLAEPEIYNEANRSQLRELLFDQARNAQLHQELEGRWLEASELLEKADAPA